MAKRLYKHNLEAEYGLGELTEYTFGGKCLLQKNFGEDYDCTLTSLAAIFGEEHYALIEKCAQKCGYEGKKCGLNPFRVAWVMEQVMKELGINGKAHARYGKNVGFTLKTIEKLLRSGHKLVLNLYHDGRGYYKNHSVLVIGTAKYGSHRLLTVYDNWNYGVSYVDYDKMCVVSSINWFG